MIGIEMVAWNRFSNLTNMLIDGQYLCDNHLPSVATIFQWEFEDNKGNMRKIADVWDEEMEYEPIDVLECWDIETYLTHLLGNVYDVPGGTMLTPNVGKCDYDQYARDRLGDEYADIKWCEEGECTCDESEPCGINYLRGY